MNSESLHKLLHLVATGKTSVDDAARTLTHISLLNSWSSNVTVVNIDNGFGAGYFASVINRMAS